MDDDDDARDRQTDRNGVKLNPWNSWEHPHMAYLYNSYLLSLGIDVEFQQLFLFNPKLVENFRELDSIKD